MTIVSLGSSISWLQLTFCSLKLTTMLIASETTTSQHWLLPFHESHLLHSSCESPPVLNVSASHRVTQKRMVAHSLTLYGRENKWITTQPLKMELEGQLLWWPLLNTELKRPSHPAACQPVLCTTCCSLVDFLCVVLTVGLAALWQQNTSLFCAFSILDTWYLLAGWPKPTQGKSKGCTILSTRMTLQVIFIVC